MNDLTFSPALLASLEGSLRHPPPFGPGELSGLRHLSVRNEVQPRGLEHLTSLGQLGLHGCEVVDFAVLRHMPEIFKVTCWASNVTSVALLPEVAPRLTWLEVTPGQLRDLRPLLELPLEITALAGNPIDEYSFRVAYPELRRRGAVPDDPRCLIEEREWELMQRFVERGLRLSAYQVGGRTQINAPGQIVHRSPEGKAEEISVRQAGRILDENPGIDERGFLAEAGRIYEHDGYVE